ncbi:DUF1433 domain-containing protein [Virgibacillus pantothenticus]|uniref:DUF1433 domain-containing protein n=1 Tax=Virgibacillus pantothenticus TaxID=1473 RepID=UPI00095410CD|nr:DUF1433 domain-containing protein [Virgibacillus pantothenticus]MED3737532.1 DUF1433 domain-containing protein [Virgibacillus pantothenticus]QTY17516.1 DUF1433 domain-containing protein [Virgibacillus pantothenticus]SIT04158.1 Protein of unknown function [Virgibacillus pantothenticus]
MRKLIFIIIIIILLGGCNVNPSSNNYDEKIITKAKNTVESYLVNNYQNINEIEFSDDTNDPMGGLMISGTINNEVGFSASVDPEKFVVKSLGTDEGFPPKKEECEGKVCDY